MDCRAYIDGTMKFDSTKSDASSTYSSDNAVSSGDSDASCAASTSSCSDVVKCCVCLTPTQLNLRHIMPSCLHAFCLGCLEKVHSTPLPDSCPICLIERQASEGACVVLICCMCDKANPVLFGRCVHCAGYLCDDCSLEHDKKPSFERHIVLKMSHPALSETGWKFGEEIHSWGNSIDISWPGDAIHSHGALSEQSWMHSSSENLWMQGDVGAGSRLEKKWMQSTAKKGWSSTMPRAMPDHSDDDSLALYSTGESTDCTSSSGDLHSLYDQIIVPHALPPTGFGLTSLASDMMNKAAVIYCVRHENERFTMYCKTCEAGVCNVCVSQDSLCAKHDCITLCSEANRAECSKLLTMRDKARAKTDQLTGLTRSVDETLDSLKHRYQSDEQRIRDSFDFYVKVLLERRQEMTLELQSVYRDCVERLSTTRDSVVYNVQQLGEAVELIRTLLLLGGSVGTGGQPQLAVVFARLHDTLEGLLSYCPTNVDRKTFDDITFVSNQQAIQAAVRNTFGYVQRRGVELNSGNGSAGYQHPLKKVYSALELSGASSSESSPAYETCIGKTSVPSQSQAVVRYGSTVSQSNNYNAYQTQTLPGIATKAIGIVVSQSMSMQNFGPAASQRAPAGIVQSIPQSVNLCENRSAALKYGFSIISVDSEDEMSKVIMPTICPSEFKRKKMEYHCKFGEFGSESHQFYEPSGVAVTIDNDILVADANNHRIQAFDRNGNYLRTIGQDHRGSGEGDLVYPNRLTVNRATGDIIVTERSPTHQVNVYNRGGQFVRKFGASILQHPRGITVDNLGRIIVVECKVMRIVIFSVVGSVLNRFIVDKHVNFPNGVAVNDREEIFISDNRRHGVVVFDYHGSFLRTVGGMGITNYPIGVGINIAGEVVIADNHNNFNVTVFTQEGVPIRALESRVKHAQCFDIALLDRGSIVLSSKDFRVYVYQYSSTPLNPLAPSVVPPSAAFH